MPHLYLPLRWESTGDQWWYVSPIDWAATNGHYDLVLELLRLDANFLIKLTSLRRICRLETVWDDDAQFVDAAMCWSIVARSLLLKCETKKGKNSLIRAGYGGWLLYTAASTRDVEFIHELLERDPLLVFGEGEYGVTDIFYAATRSKNSEVFRLLFDYSVSPCSSLGCGGDLEEQSHENVPSMFRWEMINRAVHAAARGGNLEILGELLGDGSDVLAYGDSQGSTVLHSASGRGQVEGWKMSHSIRPFQCPCGLGLCNIILSRTSSNPNRWFYRCPGKGANDCSFFYWCDQLTFNQGAKSINDCNCEASKKVKQLSEELKKAKEDIEAYKEHIEALEKEKEMSEVADELKKILVMRARVDRP